MSEDIKIDQTAQLTAAIVAGENINLSNGPLPEIEITTVNAHNSEGFYTYRVPVASSSAENKWGSLPEEFTKVMTDFWTPSDEAKKARVSSGVFFGEKNYLDKQRDIETHRIEMEERLMGAAKKQFKQSTSPPVDYYETQAKKFNEVINKPYSPKSRNQHSTPDDYYTNYSNTEDPSDVENRFFSSIKELKKSDSKKSNGKNKAPILELREEDEDVDMRDEPFGGEDFVPDDFV